MKKGDCIKVKTTTKDDVFGTCIYRAEEIGLKCPFCKGQDGIKFVMLGGDGPSARPGMVLVDCEQQIQSDMAKGITQMVNPKQAVAPQVSGVKQHGVGGIEVG